MMKFVARQGDLARMQDLRFSYYAWRLRWTLGERPECPLPQHFPEAISKQWDDLLLAETSAYISRVLQLPLEVVHEKWYNQTNGFREYALLLDPVWRKWTSEDVRRRLGVPLPFDAEVERSSWDLRDSFNAFRAARREAVPNGAGYLDLLRSSRLEQTLDRLWSTLSLVTACPGFTREDVLKPLLVEIASAYGVRVCDYFEVKGHPGGRLDLLATSVEHVEFSKGTDEPSYQEAEGITGSVFLLNYARDERWVGSSSLDDDARQSLRHSRTYQNAGYGETKAFLVFPVYGPGGDLIGAMRAIDRTDGEDPTDPWPLELRAELTHVAKWIGDMQRVIFPLTVHAWVDPGMRSLSGLGNWLEWLDRRLLARLLAECGRIAGMREEHRAVGCSVLVTNRDAHQRVMAATEKYEGLDVDEKQGTLFEAGLRGLFNRVPRGAAVYLVSSESNIGGLSDVRYEDIRGTRDIGLRKIAERLKADSGWAVLDVDGGKNVVHVIAQGGWVGDYYHNEKVGGWHLRVRQELIKGIDQLKLTDPKQAQFLSMFLERYLIPYTYDNHGGLIVLSDKGFHDQYSKPGFKVNRSLSELKDGEFGRILSQDGATWIGWDEKVRAGGIVLSTGKTGPLFGGARHQAGRSILSHVREGVVFVVSANRQVTCMQSNGVEWRF